MRDVGGVQITDRNVCCGRMQEQLVRGKDDISLGWEDDTLCALLKGSLKLDRNLATSAFEYIDRHSYQRDNICGFGGELMSQLFIVRDQVSNVNIAVKLLHQRILSKLISICTNPLVYHDSKPQNEFFHTGR